MHRRTRTITLALAVAVLAACDDSSTGLDAVEDLDAPVLTLDAEMALVIDPDLAGAAIATARSELGDASGESVRARLRLAEDHFAQARRRWAAGHPDEARDAGRRARQAIADALLEGRGRGFVDLMIDETAALTTTLGVTDAGFADAADLASTLSSLVYQAESARDQGLDNEAAERMVTARQHTDRAARDRHDDRGTDRRHDALTHDVLARLQVSQGAEAIRLAWGLIGDSPSESQLRLMETATDLQQRAEAALAEGNLGSAASLAHGAEIKALLAVVAADGVSHSGVQAVAELSGQLLEQARTAVAAGQSAIDKAILKIAVRLYEHGQAQLAAGNARGVVLLWHSATMSAVLIG